MKIKKKKAFTLIELMIVISIVVILSILLLPKAQYYIEQSKRTGIEQNRRTLLSLATSYYEKNYDSSTDNTDRIQKTYNNLIKLDDINNLQDPLNKNQTGLGLIIGNSFTDSGKAGYIFTDTPDSTKIPEGVVFVVLKDGNIVSNIGEKTNNADNSNVDNIDKLPIINTPQVVMNEEGSVSLSFYIPTPNTLYVTGTGNYGQLGLGETTEVATFTKVSIPSSIEISEFKIDDTNSYILTTDGQLYTTGADSSGRLGLGSTNTVNTFTKIPVPNNDKVVKYIDLYNMLFIISDSKVYVSGKDAVLSDLIGSNTTNSVFVEVTLPGGVKIEDVKPTLNGVIFLGDNGDVYVYGDNSNGNLGLGSVQIQPSLVKMPLPSNVKAKTIYTDKNNTIILSTDDNLYVCGENKYGSLGAGTSNIVTEPTKVAIPNNAKVLKYYYNSFTLNVLTSDYKYYACGCSFTNTINDRSSLVEVNLPSNVHIKTLFQNEAYTFIISDDNRIFTDGRDYYFDTYNPTELIPTDGSKIVEIFYDERSQCLFVKTDSGKFYGCGDNTQGQLGLGYADDGCIGWFKSPVIPPAGVNIKNIFSTGAITIIIADDGALYGIGYDYGGVLGLGTPYEFYYNKFYKIIIPN